MTRITMADVARKAGVNKGTVSRALRGDSKISAETHEKVWAAAKCLGYHVNRVASGLSSRHSGTIGVAVERPDIPFFGEFMSGLGGVLSRCKLELIFIELNGWGSPVFNVLRRFEERKVDGVICFGAGPDGFSCEAALKAIDDLGCPVVFVRGAIPQKTSERHVFCVNLEERQMVERVKELAGGSHVVYRGGDGALMPVLRQCEHTTRHEQAEATEKAQKSFIIWDGLRSFPANEKPDLVCGDAALAAFMQCAYIRYPAREFGVVSARLMSNVLREKGVRCSQVFVPAPLFKPEPGSGMLSYA